MVSGGAQNLSPASGAPASDADPALCLTLALCLMLLFLPAFLPQVIHQLRLSENESVALRELLDWRRRLCEERGTGPGSCPPGSPGRLPHLRAGSPRGPPAAGCPPSSGTPPCDGQLQIRGVAARGCQAHGQRLPRHTKAQAARSDARGSLCVCVRSRPFSGDTL